MQERQIGYFFIVMASVIIVLAGIKFAATIVIPFLLSLFIAIILSPSYTFLKSKGLPNAIAIIIVIALFLLLLAFVAKLIGTSVHSFSANIEVYASKLTIYYQAFSKFSADLGLEIPVSEITTMFDTKSAMRFFTSFINGLSSLFTNGFVVILTVVFMLLESKNFSYKIRHLDRDTDTLKHIDQIFSQIKSYMVIKSLISLFTGLLVWLFLSYVGTDYAFLWGVMAFLFNFIPNIGSIIAAVPAVLITLVQLGGLSALVVSLFYIVVNVAIGSLIEPKVMGKGLGLSTLVVFLSLIFWGWLLGIVGMLLSIPLTIMAKIIFDANKDTKWIALLLGSK